MTETTDPQTCPGCQHPQHAPNVECDQRVEHDGQRNWHLCLCLNRQYADRPCSPLMTCQGGALGYADIWYLQRGHSLSSANGVITTEVLKTTPSAPAAVPSAPADRAAILREAADEVARWYVDTEREQRMRDAIAHRLRRMGGEAQQPKICELPHLTIAEEDACEQHRLNDETQQPETQADDRLAILREEAVKLIGDCPDHSLNGGALQSCQCEAAGVLLGATKDEAQPTT